MATTKSSIRRELPLPPSCVAFSPLYLDYFVVGTYYLDKDADVNDETSEPSAEKSSQSRSGSLILFQLDGDNM